MVTMIKYKSRKEWLKARQKFIGGSDVACILGMNPWKTNVQLYREKKGLAEPSDLSDNELVIYGTKAEKYIRSLFALDHPELKVEYVPNNSWINDEYPFAAASLDGSTEDKNGRKGILEIKTSTITTSQQANKWKDQIPDNYFCQVLFYLGVTCWDYVDLRANLKYVYPERDTYTITRDYHLERSDYEQDIATVMEAAEDFHQALKKGEEPPVRLIL